MKVSIVIPIFNSGQYIQSCMDNLAKQTFRDFEIIFVVDHKTTDNSEQLILEKQADNLRFYKQFDDYRLSGARNIGLDNANGEYVWFLDVDDVPDPKFLEVMVGLLEDEHADFVCCNLIYCHEGVSDLPTVKSPKQYNLSGIDAIIDINAGKISPNAWNKLYRTAQLRDNNIRFEGDYSEDYEFLLNLCLHSSKIVRTNEPLYRYTIGIESRSFGSGNKICSTDVAIFEKYKAIVKEEYPDKYPDFCKYSIKHLLRSMTLADPKTFKQLAATESIQDSLKYCNLSDMEFLVFRISPSLYYKLGTYFRKRRYSAGARLFYPD